MLQYLNDTLACPQTTEDIDFAALLGGQECSGGRCDIPSSGLFRGLSEDGYFADESESDEENVSVE